MTETKSNIITFLIIVTLMFSGCYYVAAKSREIKQVCIGEYQYIIKKDGVPLKLLDKHDKGIPCKKEIK
jgi:hypothetical protein